MPSSERPFAFGDIVLVPFPFTDQSAVKPVIAALEQRLIIRRLGAVSSGDQQALRATIAVIVG